jgi:hypothetical protein
MKIWFFIFILPISAIEEGYKKFKKFMSRNNYSLDWAYVLLFALIILLILVTLLQYGYR